MRKVIKNVEDGALRTLLDKNDRQTETDLVQQFKMNLDITYLCLKAK